MTRTILAPLLIALSSATAQASGAGFTIPWSIDPYGGSPAEQDAFYNGNTGILLARAPWSRLFAAWRMLHGLPVGQDAGKTLAPPCCGGGWDFADAAKNTWLTARATVAGVKPLKDYEIDVFRQVGDYASVPTCFPDAFNTAAHTLTDRIAAHDPGDPAIKTWIDAQDAVFAACSGDAPLPPLPPNAPDWLTADHAYQAAATALYRRQFATAETLFDAIAADPSSPWQRSAPYLAARAAVDAALPSGQTAAYDHARAKLAALAPPDAFGHNDREPLLAALDFRQTPDTRRQELGTILTAPTLPPNAAANFKDSRRLGQSPPGQPAYLDWIAVFGRAPDKPEATWFDHYPVDQVWPTDAAALAHARAQWTATSDSAWLIAAMEWSDPGPAAADLIAAARAIPPADPAFLTALYQRIRLDPTTAQPDLDAALARTDLSLTTRNLFRSERVMAAANLAELKQLAPEESPCLTADDTEKSCLADDFGLESPPMSQQRPDVRFGDAAAAIIDRLPLRDRAALALQTSPPDQPGLPDPLRLDIALTAWVRAALIQDTPTADRLAGLLQHLLPVMQTDWATFLAAKPGEDKRFAAWFLLAKLPGAGIDLTADYTRPQGAVADFDGHWHDWLYAPQAAPPVEPPPVTGDIVCYGMCGPGAAPFRLPAFVKAAAPMVATERGRYLPADPKAASSVWEDILTYAKAHPKDPRTPEALYWLVRVSRFGTGHNRSSFRAWTILHKQYPTSHWTQASKYFYD